MEVDPVRGPVEIPKRGKLPQYLLPGLHEVMVLRSRSGLITALPRGTPPTFSQRLTGNYIEAYYVDYPGAHSRTFPTRLPTSDIGVDLIAEIDVEMTVKDCVQAVIERRGPGYLSDQLAKWAQQHASVLTSRFSVSGDGNLASLAGQVLDRLRTESERLTFSGLEIRELRVRLSLANRKAAEEAGERILTGKVEAEMIKDLFAIYTPVFGPEAAMIYASLSVDHKTEIPAFLQRLQEEQRATTANRFSVLIALLQGEAIEPHMREQLLQDLATSLKLPGIGVQSQDLASAMYKAAISVGASDAKPPR